MSQISQPVKKWFLFFEKIKFIVRIKNKWLWFSIFLVPIILINLQEIISVLKTHDFILTLVIIHFAISVILLINLVLPSRKKNTLHYTSNSAIISPDDDKYGVTKFAENLASYIQSIEESQIIGLEGEWGEGKTSIKNIMLTKIDSNKFDVVDFSVWDFSGANNVIEVFFQMVIMQLKENGVSDILIKHIKNYSKFIIPLFSNLNSSLLDSLVNDFLSWDVSSKNKLSEYLKSSDKTLLIIIDDLDRVSYEELLKIFQIVKAIFNFPRIKFFAIYSKNNIEKLIESKKDYTPEFFEKMIDVIIPMPIVELSMELNARVRILYELFNKHKLDYENKYSKIENFSNSGFYEFFQSKLNNKFINHRDFNKFINYLECEIVALKKCNIDSNVFQIDFADFIAIKIICYKDKDLYREIYKAFNHGVGFKSIYDQAFEGKKEIDEFINMRLNIINKSENESENIKIKSTYDIFNFLFSESESNKIKFYKEFRILNMQLFKNYFIQQENIDYISESRVREYFFPNETFNKIKICFKEGKYNYINGLIDCMQIVEFSESPIEMQNDHEAILLSFDVFCEQKYNYRIGDIISYGDRVLNLLRNTFHKKYIDDKGSDFPKKHIIELFKEIKNSNLNEYDKFNFMIRIRNVLLQSYINEYDQNLDDMMFDDKNNIRESLFDKLDKYDDILSYPNRWDEPEFSNNRTIIRKYNYFSKINSLTKYFDGKFTSDLLIDKFYICKNYIGDKKIYEKISIHEDFMKSLKEVEGFERFWKDVDKKVKQLNDSKED